MRSKRERTAAGFRLQEHKLDESSSDEEDEVEALVLMRGREMVRAW